MFLFNLTFVLIINLSTTAIISGIIIDTFGEMRGAREVIEEDDKNNCFICCIERETFDKVNIDFEEHQLEYHNRDAYCWLKYYLVKKSFSEMTGIESYIYSIIKLNKVTYYPVRKSIQIERIEGEQFLDDGMAGINAKLDKILEEVNYLKKSQNKEEE